MEEIGLGSKHLVQPLGPSTILCSRDCTGSFRNGCKVLKQEAPENDQGCPGRQKVVICTLCSGPGFLASSRLSLLLLVSPTPQHCPNVRPPHRQVLGCKLHLYHLI